MAVLISIPLLLSGCATLGDLGQWAQNSASWGSSSSVFGASNPDRWPGSPSAEENAPESLIPEPDPWGRSPSEVAREQARQREERRVASVRRARSVRDIVPGMETHDVRTSWGPPSRIEYAGDPSLGNERWTYSEGLSRMGISRARIIYFENGQVAGWETVRQ